MPKELILQILDDVSRWEKPLAEVVPVNYGEVFLYPDWEWLMRIISQKLPQTTMTLATNGALLDEAVAMKISTIPTLRIINFSINAYYDETYEKFMGLKAEVIPQIRRIVTLLRILRPDIRQKVSMVFDPQYQDDMERDLFKNYWISYAEPWVLPAASAGRGTIIKIPRVLPCRSIFSDFVIGFDGKLSSCCFDCSFALDLGNYSDNVKKDWLNDKIEELRRIHNEGRRTEIPLCSSCSFA